MVGPPPQSWEVAAGHARAYVMAPGIWQLRLPLAWDDVPHVNAYVIEEDDGIVLVDCGSAGHPSLVDALDDAIALTGHAVSDVRLLVGTHTHSDHIGLAAHVIRESGCTFLMHGDTAHFYDAMRDPARIEAARARRATQEGVPVDLLGAFADVREETEGVLAATEPHRGLRDGDRVVTGVGEWTVLETPGHAPSHVCLAHQERRIIILGDLLAPVFSPWFDYGYTPDPVGEFLVSLDRVQAAGPFDLALPGHGRAIEDLPGALELHRRGVIERLQATLDAVRSGPAAAYVIATRVFGEPDTEMDAVWHTTEAICLLCHLRAQGLVVRGEADGGCFTYTPAQG
jgi:glyoxylase-like metal-dependent hydrolase (beta-lactamase superfamily II)